MHDLTTDPGDTANTAANTDDGDDQGVEEQESLYLDTDDEWESVQFLLHVTEEHSLTHNGVDSLCDSVQWFVDGVCSRITEKVKYSITSITDPILKEDILSACKPGDLFPNLKSRYMREKYYQEKFNYVVCS